MKHYPNMKYTLNTSCLKEQKILKEFTYTWKQSNIFKGLFKIRKKTKVNLSENRQLAGTYRTIFKKTLDCFSTSLMFITKYYSKTSLDILNIVSDSIKIQVIMCFGFNIFYDDEAWFFAKYAHLESHKSSWILETLYKKISVFIATHLGGVL